MDQQGLGLTARRAVKEDEKKINELVDMYKPQYTSQYGSFSVGNLIETSVLAITVVDENNQVCGFASFNDAPPGGYQYGKQCQHNWTDWQSSSFHIPNRVENSVWCTSFVCMEDFKSSVFEIIFHTCYATLHWVASILVYVSIDTPLHNLALSLPSEDDNNQVQTNANDVDSQFSKLDPLETDYFGPSVYCNSREMFIPSMVVRRARIEDFDDISPLCEEQSGMLQSIYGEYFLAELIEGQDDESICLVAEVSGRAAGIMAATSDVDVTLLNSCFDLSLYDGLMKTRAQGNDVNSSTSVSTTVAKPFELYRSLAALYDPLLSIYIPDYKATGIDGEPTDMTSNNTNLALPDTKTLPAQVDFKEVMETKDVSQLFLQAWRVDPAVDVRRSFGVIQYAMLEQFLAKAIQEKPLVPDVSIDVTGKARISNASRNILVSAPNTIAALSMLEGLRTKDLTRAEFVRTVCAFAAAACSVGSFSTRVRAGEAAVNVLLEFLSQACHPSVVYEKTAKELEALEEKRLDELFAKQAFAAVVGDMSAETLKSLSRRASMSRRASQPGLKGLSSASSLESLLDANGSTNVSVVAPSPPEPETPQCNAFAIVLYCLADALEPRALDFLPFAFDLFPDRDYCILTLPHTYPEHDLLSHFTVIPPKPESTLPHALYIVHRDALQAQVSVSWAQEMDSSEILDLLSSGSDTTEGHVTKKNENGEDVITKLDGVQLVHGRLPAGSAAYGVYQLFLTSLEDDQRQEEVFEKERVTRRLAREKFASLPKPRNGVDPMAAANAKAMDYDEMEDSVLKYTDVRGRLRNISTFCVRANGVLVGIFALRTRDRRASAQAEASFAIHEYFNIADVCSFQETHADARAWCTKTLPFADVISVVLNPLFRTHLPFICREIMRQAYKQILLVPNSNFMDLHGLPVYLKARSAPALPSGTTNQTPLVTGSESLVTGSESLRQGMGMVTRKLQSLPRAVIHARVVIVGASDTALCAVQALQANSDVFLSNITVVSVHPLPKGYPSRGAQWLPWSVDVSAESLEKSGMEHLVRFIPDAVVGVDTTNQFLRLGSGTLLPYDCVAFTTGLSDATCATVGADAWRVDSERNTQRLASALGITYSQGYKRGVNQGMQENEDDENDEENKDAGEQGENTESGERKEYRDPYEGIFGKDLIAPVGAVEGLVTIVTETDAVELEDFLKRRKPSCLVVYGDTPRAVAALGALLRGGKNSGVQAEGIIWAFPGAQDAGEWCEGNHSAHATLLTALESRFVTIMPHMHVEAVRCTPMGPQGGRLARLVCRNTTTQALFGLVCDVMICCSTLDTNPYIFAALAAASAAYDGRLLLSEDLSICGVSSNKVLGSGPLCKFSRRCGLRAPLAAWSPAVSGQVLANAIVNRVDSSAQDETRVSSLEELGSPGRAVYVECAGLQYLHVTQDPIETATGVKGGEQKSDGKDDNTSKRTVLQSNVKGRHCTFVFGGRANILTEITVLADVATHPESAFPVKTIYKYIGTPSVYLPHLFTCQTDILDALWSPTTVAYAHDGFNALRHAAAASLIENILPEFEDTMNKLISGILEAPSSDRILAGHAAVQQLDEQKKAFVRERVWEYVVANRDHLPGYVVPEI